MQIGGGKPQTWTERAREAPARPHARARAFGRPGRQRVGRDDDDCLKDFGARYNFYKYLCLRHLRRAGKVRSCLRGAAAVGGGRARAGEGRQEDGAREGRGGTILVIIRLSVGITLENEASLPPLITASPPR